MVAAYQGQQWHLVAMYANCLRIWWCWLQILRNDTVKEEIKNLWSLWRSVRLISHFSGGAVTVCPLVVRVVSEYHASSTSPKRLPGWQVVGNPLLYNRKHEVLILSRLSDARPKETTLKPSLVLKMDATKQFQLHADRDRPDMWTWFILYRYQLHKVAW